jgi:hypothetical protein
MSGLTNRPPPVNGRYSSQMMKKIAEILRGSTVQQDTEPSIRSSLRSGAAKKALD